MFWVFFWVGVFVFNSSSVFSAGTELRLGKLKVVPSIGYNGKFESNIYSAEVSEIDDFIHTITPMISLDYAGAPGNFFSTGYKIDLVAYNEFDDNNYHAQNPFVRFGLKSPSGVYLTASDNYITTEDPYGSANTYGVGSLTKRWNNTAEFVLGFEFAEKYAIEGQYKHYVQRYDLVADRGEDKTEHTFGASIYYKITGKTSIFLNYIMLQAEYDYQNDNVAGSVWNTTNSEDHKKNDYFLGIKFVPGGKLSGQIKLGGGDLNFDNAVDRTGYAFKDENSFYAQADIQYTVSPKTGLSMMLNQSIVATPVDAEASSYAESKIELGLTKGIGDRINLNFGLNWTGQDYLNERPGFGSKSFNIYAFDAGIGFMIFKWLNAGLAYEYETKNSSNANYKTDEYDLNRVSVKTDITF